MDHEALIALHGSLMRNVIDLQAALVGRDRRIAELEHQLQAARTNGHAPATGVSARA